MLIQFRVKNFKSFKDEQILSLVASPDTNLSDNTISIRALRKMKLVKSAIMYGANASGKSNLVSAINFVKEFVTKSAVVRPDSLIPVRRFQLDTERKQPSEFEITFIHEEVRYEYGFSVDEKRIYDEWLIAFPKGVAQTWFERPTKSDASEEEWYFGRHLKGEKNKLIPLTRPNVLFLSVAAKFNNPQLSSIYEWFSEKLNIIDDETPSQILELMTLRTIQDSEDLHVKVRNLLKVADLGIVDFSVEETPVVNTPMDIPQDAPEQIKAFFSMLTKISQNSDSEHMRQLSVAMRHQIEEGDTTGVKFGFNDESRGTRRLFGLSSLLFSVLQKGGLLVIDELDSSLHPVLARELLNMFHNPKINKNGAQLLFNTHDTTLLDLSLFRRDQIWFMEKDNRGISHLYSLLDFKPRKTEAISKGYLQGRYGAIPFLSNIEEFFAHGS